MTALAETAALVGRGLERTGMLVLASASPRRQELLRQAGFVFMVQAEAVDETPRVGEEATALACRLAQAKAEACAAGSAGSAQSTVGSMDAVDEAGTLRVFLGADTVVVAPNGEILGKPADDADAARMLGLLSGATHQVITGVCAHVPGAARTEVAAAMTWVRVQTLSTEEIAAYVATGEPQGKAGAYAIQGRFARAIPAIHGEYANVVGLPLALVGNMLAAFGIGPG
jgi:septum formation protein